MDILVPIWRLHCSTLPTVENTWPGASSVSITRKHRISVFCLLDLIMPRLQICSRVQYIYMVQYDAVLMFYLFLLYKFTHFLIKFVHPLRWGASGFTLQSITSTVQCTYSFPHCCPLSRRAPLSWVSNKGPPYSSSTRYCATNWTIRRPLSTELRHASELRRTRVYMYNFSSTTSYIVKFESS